jgi:hypothetical protein
MAAFGDETAEALRGKFGIIRQARDPHRGEAFLRGPSLMARASAGHGSEIEVRVMRPGAMPRIVSASSGRKEGRDFTRWYHEVATGNSAHGTSPK